MHAVGLDTVALEGEQHPLPPGGIKPGVYSHVIADEDGVQSDARVPPLEEVAQLEILEISVTLHAKVGVCGVRHGRPTGPLGQGEARVAAGAPGPVLCGAGGTAEAVAHGAGNEALAWRMAVGAGAAAALIAVNADLLVLTAVQHGQSVAQPEMQRPEGDTTNISVRVSFTLLWKKEKCASVSPFDLSDLQ